MKHTLEGQKLFPVVAWLLVIVGALFVIKLSLALQNIGSELGDNTNQTVKALHSDVPSYTP